MKVKRPSGEVQGLGTLLVADDLKRGKNVVKVVAIREAPDKFEFSDYIMDLTFDGDKYALPLKVESSSFETLVDAMGDETDDWVGKEVVVRPRYTSKYPDGFVEILAVSGGKSKEESGRTAARRASRRREKE